MSRFLDGDRKSTRLNSSHTVIYTLSLHDALPISNNYAEIVRSRRMARGWTQAELAERLGMTNVTISRWRSEEHTSELQSHSDLHSFPTRRSSDLKQLCRNRPVEEDGPRLDASGACGAAWYDECHDFSM